ncbi:hypothetical protein Tco_1123342 [Tanacetum coccineum]|uniref:Uncharacterized protein n=1 Tax=Tanacetum coccineum TaxID=301880 RepID=A0ABQ5J326_9ASTR
MSPLSHTQQEYHAFLIELCHYTNSVVSAEIACDKKDFDNPKPFLLKDVEHGKERIEDAEKTNASHDDGTQETTYERVKDDEHVILTTVHDTQKTEVPLQSSLISSDFATQFLNLDNPSPADTKINSMINIDVRHEEQSTQTPPLLTILVMKAQGEKKRYIDLVEKSVKDLIKYEVKSQLPQILPKEVSNYATPPDKDLFESYGKAYSIKRDHEDKDIDEDPHAGSNQRLKRRKTSKDSKPSKRSKSKESKSISSKGTKSQSKSSERDWFKKLKRPLTFDSDWNARKSIDFRPPQTWISSIAQEKKPPLTFDKLMSTPIDFSTYVMNNLKIDNLTQEHLVGPTLIFSKGHAEVEWNSNIISKNVIKLSLIDLTGITLKDMNIHLTLASLYRRLKIEAINYQKKLNITKPETFKSDISKRTPYTAYNNPQGIIYVDKFKRNRLMRSDELYKFSNGTLTSVRSVLHDIAFNLRMDYLLKRRWSNLDKQRSRIMIKAIDKLQLERRLMRSLEKFVGGRDYREDFRLLEWII